MADEILDTAGQKETKEPIWRAFLTAFSELGNFGEACAAIGVKHSTVRNALKNVSEFRGLYDEAKQILADRIEGAFDKRAIYGVRRLKFNREGKACIDPATDKPYEETQYDTVAGIVRLKAIRPLEYRERYEHTGPGAVRYRRR